GFLLPGIAVLHVRHAAVRQSGAILATIAGAAVATVGLAGSANLDVRPAALFVLGLWWWTIGKMWVETRGMPRPFGLATAARGWPSSRRARTSSSPPTAARRSSPKADAGRISSSATWTA